MREEQAIFNLEIKKKSGLSINPDIHHSKVFSSGLSFYQFVVFICCRKYESSDTGHQSTTVYSSILQTSSELRKQIILQQTFTYIR